MINYTGVYYMDERTNRNKLNKINYFFILLRLQIRTGCVPIIYRVCYLHLSVNIFKHKLNTFLIVARTTSLTQNTTSPEFSGT